MNENGKTVSELLSEAADKCRLSACGSMAAIDVMRKTFDVESKTSYEQDMAATLKAIADRVDAELEANEKAVANYAIDCSLRVQLPRIARDLGWPETKGGEYLKDYIDRCFLPRPLFEDGEPVQDGDMFRVGDSCESDANYAVMALDGSCWALLSDYGGDIDDDPIKRPEPEVLGADGLPIKVGETVWHLKTGEEHVVEAMTGDGGFYINRSSLTWNGCSFTHTPPDTQEAIDADKCKVFPEYWKCLNVPCEECPNLTDGKKPTDYYGVINCTVAQGMDITRRQQELDARTMGGEVRC